MPLNMLISRDSIASRGVISPTVTALFAFAKMVMVSGIGLSFATSTTAVVGSPERIHPGSRLSLQLGPEDRCLRPPLWSGRQGRP